MHNLKVVTVTLNPALDLLGSTDKLILGQVNSVKFKSVYPAGKGINVAKVLAQLGANVTVTGLMGVENEEPFRAMFESLNITDRFLRVHGANRTNVKVLQGTSDCTDINFDGIEISDADMAIFEEILFELAEANDIFVIAGSLPKGMNPSRLRNLIETLCNSGKTVLLDTSYEALAEGIKAQPYLIKPNDAELAALMKQPLNTRKDMQEASEKLFEQGCANVVVSMGKDGAMWLDKQGWQLATLPKRNVVSSVGAGDTLVAGLCWGLLNNWDKEQTLSFSTAMAALAVSQVGVGINDISEVTDLQAQTTITTL